MGVYMPFEISGSIGKYQEFEVFQNGQQSEGANQGQEFIFETNGDTNSAVMNMLSVARGEIQVKDRNNDGFLDQNEFGDNNLFIALDANGDNKLDEVPSL